jgi:hypothetical protein
VLDDRLRFTQYGVMRRVVPQLDACATTPLTEPVLLILLGLSDKPRHGYAVLKDIEVLTNGRVRLSTGTIYGALRRLSRNKWIERFEQGDKSRDRQAYKVDPCRAEATTIGIIADERVTAGSQHAPCWPSQEAWVTP